MAKRSRPALPPLLVDAMFALRHSQQTFGERFGASRKTVGRWQSGRSVPAYDTVESIAREVHPIDPTLAEQLMASQGETLVSAGIVAPPPIVSPSTEIVPPSPPPIPARYAIDTVLCAAAEAMGTTPQAVRAAVQAAFTRAHEIGYGVEAVLEGFAPTPAPKTAGRVSKEGSAGRKG